MGGRKKEWKGERELVREGGREGGREGREEEREGVSYEGE